MTKNHHAFRSFRLLCAGLFFLAAGPGWAAHPGIDWDKPVFTEQYVAGELLVGFKGEAVPATVAALHRQVGAEVVRQFRITPVAQVRLPRQVSLAQAAKQYLADPAVAYVEPNYILRPVATVPDDPHYGDLWGMERIRAPEAWDITQGSQEMVVGIIDTGIYTAHQDLQANIAPGSYDFANDIPDQQDNHGHGTHVSGTIGAVGNNALGVAGVNWQVKMIALKFLDPYGSTADAIEAVEYAATNTALKIKITNNSWGGGGYSQGLYDAIKKAGEVYGQLFIAAAGNDGEDNDAYPHYPSSYDLPNLIAVAAIDSAGELADFSNYGLESVDLAAPGVDILSTVPGGGGDALDSYSGTSMACPHVAGAAALLWSLNPDYPYTVIRDALLTSVAPNANLDGKVVTGGELDLYAAVAALGPQVALDRPAYQSDATVQVTVSDPTLPAPLPADVTADGEIRDPDGVLRWSDALTLPYDAGISFTGQLALASGTMAVDGDTLTISYTSPGGKTATAAAPIDDTPPVISGVKLLSLTEDTAVVSWATDEPADSRYVLAQAIPAGGLATLLPETGGGVYVDTPTVVEGVTQYVHEVSIPVEGATRYFVAVLSEDYAGNKASAPADLTSTVEDDYLKFITPLRRVVYENDMESGVAGWTITNLNGVACWEYGIPTFGPVGAHSGMRAWGTILDGNYPHLAKAAVVGTSVEVKLNPRLEFWSWHQFGAGDFGVIEVNAGAGWVNVTAQSSFGANVVEGSAAEWQLVTVELANFSNQAIRVRFRIESDAQQTAAGWYLDDVRISHVLPPGISIVSHVIDDLAGGDGDGHAEPGESFFLDLEVYNSTQTQALMNARATVTVPTPGVTLTPTPATVLYGDLDPGDNAFSGTQLPLAVAADVPGGTWFTVFHSAQADGGLGPYPDTLAVEIAVRESVTGVVTDLFTGNPIADAWIRGQAPGYPELEAYSGADGTYALHGLVPGVAYDIRALKPGEYSPSAPVSRTGPATANFGLGRATANPAPLLFVLELGEGGAALESLALDNSTGNLPLDYDLRVDYLPHPAMAEIPAWLAVDPAAGAVPAGAGATVEVAVAAADLTPSEQPYEAILRLISNDIGGEDILIPVTLTVAASPVLYIQGTRVIGGDGDAYPEAGESLDIDIFLGNSGSQDALQLAGIVSYGGGTATTVDQDAVSWISVPAGSAASPVVDPLTVPPAEYPRITLDPALAAGEVVEFDLEVTDVEARVTALTFALTVTVRHAISGNVQDMAAAPVEGAVVKVVGSNFTGQALTDAAGDYQVFGLVNGAYEVYVLPPPPYGAPPARIVPVADADVPNVDFTVAPWNVTAAPDPIAVTLREGTGTNLTLEIDNAGVFDGFVELGIELVSGIPHDRVGEVVLPATDWASLPAEAYVPGELLVRFEDAAGLQAQAGALAAVGAQVLRRFDLVSAALVRVPANRSLPAIADTLTADAAIRYVEPNYRRKPFAVPEDPFFGQMYGLENTRQTGGTLGADIRAPQAWDITVGSTGTVIAVVDTGVKLDHVDLAANLVPGYDCGDDDPDPTPDPIADVAEHGTHVAGTIGAVGDNRIGVVGVNWNSKLMPLKIATVVIDPLTGLETLSLSAAAAIDALNRAVAEGVKISNHSYGGSYFSGVEYETIAAALAQDHLVVAAAGNDTLNNDVYPSYPASYNLDNIVSVAATDHDGLLAWFSNYGEQSVDIAAPGVDILSTYLDVFTMADGYKSISGTSMAAPHVAGVAGLMKSIAPWATPAMLRDALMLGARRDPVLAGKVASGGHLDAAAALEQIQAFWLQLDLERGNIPAGDRLSVEVAINAAGQLPAGTYTANIVIRGGVNVLMVPVTVDVLAAPFPVITEVRVVDNGTGDGDSHAEPSETVDLYIRLFNDGSALYANPTGTLASATAGVVIQQGTAAWPGIPSGQQQSNTLPFRVRMPAAAGPAEFTLTMVHPTRGPWVLSFTVPVARRHTISGVVRDAQTAAGLGGLAVEYWGAAGGRVLTDAGGAYRLDGLEDGVYRVRALGESHEKSAATVCTIAGGNQTAHFSLRRPEVAFGATQLEFAVQAGQDQELELLLDNPAADSFQFRILSSQPRRIGLISDRNNLAPLQPVLQALGWTVALWSNNLAVADGVQTGLHSTDEEVVLPQDLVILDLGGTAGTGRLLSAAEETLFNTYLARGGKLIVVGANVLTRPDDRRMCGLVGADSLDRAAGTGTVAVLAQALPIDTNWVAIQPGDRVAVAPRIYDEATPDAAETVASFFEVDGAPKIMRRVTADGGVVVLWNGNLDAGEWNQRGVWQDVLQGLVENELREPVAWLHVTPESAGFSGGSLPVTVRAESAGLAIGTHQAVLLVRGNYPGADVRTVAVSFEVARPTLRAQSTTGVQNWMGQYLSGTGGPDASLFQLVYAGPDGAINAPRTDGQTTGDDVILLTFPFGRNHGRIGVGYEWLPEHGRFDENFQHDLMPTTPVRNVYVRAWDAATFVDSVAYGDSGLYALDLSAGETHDFGTWVVNRVLGYPGTPGALPDSNGDSIPDGYCVLNGMDPHQLILPLEAGWTQQQAVGDYGTATGQFRFPTRLFLTEAYVFVLDRENSRISVWNRATLAHVRNYGANGTGAGQFASPYGLGKDPNADRFAVADSANHRIQVFTFHPGTGQIAFERQFGSYGSANGQFKNPRDVAIDPLGRFFVADKDNHRVQVFDPEGNFQFAFGAYGTANGQLKSPQGIAVDADGIVYVADTDNDRLQGFSGGGAFLWKTGTAGNSLGQFNKPMDLQLGPGGRLYVADTSNHRIQVLNPSRTPVGALGQYGSGDGEVKFPHDAAPALDSGAIYVADTWNHRLLQLEAVLDGDGDGMDDTYELLHDLDPTNPLDAMEDDDGDLLLNIGEYRLRLNPQVADTDGDGYTDGEEVAAGADPADPTDAPLYVRNLQPAAPFTFTWMGSAGMTYAVQVTSNLVSAPWMTIPGSEVAVATSGLQVFTNLDVNVPWLFFRPVRLP